MPEISVVICTHNPRLDYLGRVLDALQRQSLSKDEWELLIIDNASEAALENEYDLSWHRNARHIREEALGLTQARLRGIRDSTGQLLVFVDDDNVLEEHYLENTLRIAGEYSKIGAWCGSVTAEFEIPPPHYLNAFRGCFHHEVDKDAWSESTDCADLLPTGAGLCIRRDIAERYGKSLDSRHTGQLLGRRGASLGAGEDFDLALTARELEYGTGRFKDLKLVHLIPKERMRKKYLVRLSEGIHFSVGVVKRLHHIDVGPLRSAGPIRHLIELLRLHGGERLEYIGYHRAQRRLQRWIATEDKRNFQI